MLITPLQLAGGIGLFLIGMILMTDGIKLFAGDALRQALVRFTGRPLRAFLSGILVTMLVQSSSATTMTVIGFVSAGLLTFSQAICVVIGASVGTTGTSWLVSVFGLKFSLGLYALPLVAVGALLRLLAAGQWRHAGLPLAGFGLLFVGIETLQQGMQAAASELNISGRPTGSFWDPVLFMFSGIVLTIVTQSSSAATATILTALHTHSINFEQAAALVIGAAIGTTLTSVLAAIGATVPAKRTALSHVIFNLATGLIAVVLLPAFLAGIAAGQRHFGLAPGAISLAVFHTAFIALGALLFLPLVGPFSRWIERMLPETGPKLTRHLDEIVLHVPEVALEASRRALSDTAAELFDTAVRCLRGQTHGSDDASLQRVHDALEHIQQFLTQIPYLPKDGSLLQTPVDQMHALDHLLRLKESLPPAQTVLKAIHDPQLQDVVHQTTDILNLASAGLRGRAEQGWSETVRQLALELAESRRRNRPLMLQASVFSKWDPKEALNLLDAMRWLDQLAYHTWRVGHYLHGDASQLKSNWNESQEPDSAT